MLYFYCGQNNYFVLISALVLGGLFDIYYLNRFFLAVFLLPILEFFMNKVSMKFLSSRFQTLIFFLITLFLFESIGELGSEVLKMSNMPMSHFITYCLAPTLIYNACAFFVVQSLFKKLFLNNKLQ